MKLRNKIAVGAALAMFLMLPTAVEYGLIANLGQHVATDGTVISENGTAIVADDAPPGPHTNIGPDTVDTDGTVIVQS